MAEGMNGAVIEKEIVSKNLPARRDLNLRFNHVSYVLKQEKKSVKILNDTCGEFMSGRMTAILGPSGAGKTSMLNVLSCFKAQGVTGSFELNGEERKLLAFRKMSSYIPQEFVMLDLLTVEETLKVSADLKFPEYTKASEINKIIDDVLQILNMTKCRNTLVLNLSGGERKRLSIGIELVTNPPLMFFDEPTSGLDSVASFQLINHLRRLAIDGNRIVICVVHQPSSRLINLFDDVLVMSAGEVLYGGPQSEMIDHFKRASFICPNYYNPADFALEVASEPHSDQIQLLIKLHKETHFRNEKVNQYPTKETTELLANQIDDHTSIQMNNIAAEGELMIQQQSCATVRPKTQVSLWKQFTVLMRRSLKSMSRNLLAVKLRVIMHVLVALLMGTVFWNMGNDAEKVLTNSSCIFFMMMFIFFGNSMPSILLCPQDMAVFLREYLNGWYSLRAYFLAKIIADIPMQFICPTLFMSIIYLMSGQPQELGRFTMCWWISLLMAVIGHFFGLICGSLFHLQLAVFIVPTIAMPLMIFSGFFIRIHEMFPCLRPLCDISFFRYSLEGFMQAIYGYDRPDLDCPSQFCYFKSPQKFLKELGMYEARYGIDSLTLLLWIIALVIIFFLSLVWRLKKAQ